MNGGRVQPPGRPEQRGGQPDYGHSAIAEQRLSAGGHLRQMTFLEGVVYYVFFGWAWGFGARLEKKQLINEILEIKGDIQGLDTLKIDQLKKIKGVLQIPAGRVFISNANTKEFLDILQHEKAIEIFQNFEKAQALLQGRVNNEIAKEINTYFLSQSNAMVDDLTNFITYAAQLEEGKPDAFPNSTASFHLTNQLRSKLNPKDELRIIHFLDEIVFVTTASNLQPIFNALDSPKFLSIHVEYEPFSIQYKPEKMEGKVAVTLKDPLTQKVRRIELLNPQEVTTTELDKFQKKIELSEDRWLAAKQFFDRAHQALAEGIYYLAHPNPFDEARLAISRGEGSVLMPVTNENIPEVVTLTARENKGAIDVEFLFKDITYRQSYLLKEGETQAELAERMMNDRTLERDLEIAKGYFTRSPVAKIEQREPQQPTTRKMGFQFKKKKK